MDLNYALHADTVDVEHAAWLAEHRAKLEYAYCADCGDRMDARRAEPRHLKLTRGLCSECVCHPVRETARIERERRVAAFGEGRC